MRIDPTVEAATRGMLNHVIRGELDELHSTGAAQDERTLQQTIALCVSIAAYVAVDVCGGDHPSDTDLRKLAENVANAETEFQLTAAEVHDYVARSALGGEPLDRVFSAEDAGSLPFLVTGSLLASYSPDGQEWWDYLDAVEAAIEAASEPS